MIVPSKAGGSTNGGHTRAHPEAGATSAAADAANGVRDAMLLDLGLAIRISESALGSALGSALVACREPFGVIGYRAPEVHRRMPYGTAVDVFAFGRVVYAMLVAIHPAPRERRVESLIARVVSPTLACWAYERLVCQPPVSGKWPRGLADIVLACTSCDPTLRPSAAELAEKLSREAKSS